MKVADVEICSTIFLSTVLYYYSCRLLDGLLWSKRPLGVSYAFIHTWSIALFIISCSRLVLQNFGVLRMLPVTVSLADTFHECCVVLDRTFLNTGYLLNTHCHGSPAGSLFYDLPST